MQHSSLHNAKKIAIVLALALVILSSWFAFLDLPATQRIDTALKRALISFTTARALNAVISVAQGTEIAAQPMGVGVTLTPGQLLDPVNDLVEKFSSLMLAAAVALGIQKALIHIGGYWPLSLLLTLTALRWGWLYLRQQKPPVWLSKILILLLMIRFAIPIVTIGTDYVFDKYLVAEYTASQQSMDLASNDVSELVEDIKAELDNKQLTEDESLWQKSKAKLDGFINKTKESLDVKAHVAKLQAAAQIWTKHIINLIVIFLLQTLCLPLLLMWFLYLGVKRLVD